MKKEKEKKDLNNLQIHEQKEKQVKLRSGKKKTLMATLCII